MSASMEEIDTNCAEDYVPVDFTDPNAPHDRVLVVGEKKFYVFAGHLSFCSEFFNTMFNSDFKEKNQSEIELKELDPEGFYVFLKTLIPGNTSVINGDNYLYVMACARRFIAPSVMTICGKFAMDSFDALDKIQLLTFAFEYNQKTLKAKLADFWITGKFISSSSSYTHMQNCIGSKNTLSCSYCLPQLAESVKANFFVEKEEEL